MEYTGGRTADTITSWILKKSGPASVEVTCDQLKEKIEGNKFVLAFFGEESEALYKDAHLKFADVNDKITFVHSKDAACAKTYNAAAPAEVFFRKFEENVIPYTGAPDVDSLTNFVKPLLVATVFEFGEDEIEAIFGQQMPTVFLFRGAEDKDAAFMTTFGDAAKANKGKMLFTYSDINDGIQARLAEFMGITADQLPTLRAILPADMKKYAAETKAADLTVDLVTKFVDDVLAGNIQPHLKTEEIPEKNDGPVTVVVGK